MEKSCASTEKEGKAISAATNRRFLPTQICVRQYDDLVPQYTEMELRGFVYKNQLNALTQYDNCAYTPRIAEHAEEVQQRVRHFFDTEVRDKLAVSHESYVIDFLVLPERVMVIEINPFHAGAGVCLFSWATDRKTFMFGPFEFRYVKSPMPNIFSKVPGSGKMELEAEKIWKEFGGKGSLKSGDQANASGLRCDVM